MPVMQSYSQHGEDIWLASKFGYERGHAVDVGASDGILLSNTFQLENSGWEVLCIEPNPLYEKHLKLNRKKFMRVAVGAKAETADFSIYQTVEVHEPEQVEAPKFCLDHYMSISSLKPSERLSKMHPSHPDSKKPTMVVKVQVLTLDECLEKAGFPKCDVASIDTEETELDVLKGFDTDRWKTRVVIVENNFDEDGTRAEMRRKGFKMTERLGVNDMWEKANG